MPDIHQRRHHESLQRLSGLPGSDPELIRLAESAAGFRAMADMLHACPDARYEVPAFTVDPRIGGAV
ncbi:hypothetical protein [Gordonia hankookensis]|uniref:Uncharacterized protein n=1 Tax=Gordonia hankookensis TaxID=589403 RepID=A0ABR7WI82_9ACTN|nr:hypothetical protein [Gordonia hankookensis]MBD1322459.1 hypothetical protein [Gordonia hankookensis]NDZ97592.1 hypothetical protein [Streptomyces sp. SID11726]NEB26937.1 hypothetical protein [Streptomyces sp. SID6673]NED61558.1 hypothetical protein [Streptomyces sp. SID10244]